MFLEIALDTWLAQGSVWVECLTVTGLPSAKTIVFAGLSFVHDFSNFFLLLLLFYCYCVLWAMHAKIHYFYFNSIF